MAIVGRKGSPNRRKFKNTKKGVQSAKDYAKQTNQTLTIAKTFKPKGSPNTNGDGSRRRPGSGGSRTSRFGPKNAIGVPGNGGGPMPPRNVGNRGPGGGSQHGYGTRGSGSGNNTYGPNAAANYRRGFDKRPRDNYLRRKASHTGGGLNNLNFGRAARRIAQTNDIQRKVDIVNDPSNDRMQTAKNLLKGRGRNTLGEQNRIDGFMGRPLKK